MRKKAKKGMKQLAEVLPGAAGCSPSLTKDLVMFTDNQETVNLLALDMKTGEVVASLPVIDELPEAVRYLLKILRSCMITVQEP